MRKLTLKARIYSICCIKTVLNKGCPQPCPSPGLTDAPDVGIIFCSFCKYPGFLHCCSQFPLLLELGNSQLQNTPSISVTPLRPAQENMLRLRILSEVVHQQNVLSMKARDQNKMSRWSPWVKLHWTLVGSSD